MYICILYASVINSHLRCILPFKVLVIFCIQYLLYLYDEELHGLYSSPSIVRVIKVRRMGWAGHVARMGEVRGAYNILVGRPEGRNH
jgi:tetrahydromethanopterin S-methyltransferase subunit E